MPTPEFILRLREKIGHDPLWLIGVTAVVVRGDEVLLVERADNGKVTPVTGIVDPGEQPADAAVREVAEEAGVVAEATGLARVLSLPAMQHVNGDRAQYLDLTFRCTCVSGEPHPADGENVRAWWHPISDLDGAGLDDDMRERVTAALDHATATAYRGGESAALGSAMREESAASARLRRDTAENGER